MSKQFDVLDSAVRAEEAVLLEKNHNNSYYSSFFVCNRPPVSWRWLIKGYQSSVLMVARTDSDWHGDSLVVVVVVGTYMESYGMVVGLLLPKLLLLLMRGCGHHDLMIVLLLKTEK